MWQTYVTNGIKKVLGNSKTLYWVKPIDLQEKTNFTINSNFTYTILLSVF